MWSPATEAGEDFSSELPPLALASDLYFLSYYIFWQEEMALLNVSPNGGSTIPAPDILVIPSIVETEASTRIFPDIGIRFSPADSGGRKWPGWKFTPDSDYFKVILATKQGRGVSHWLFQHKDVFGAKSISSITLFKAAGWALKFELGASPPPTQQPPAVLARQDSGVVFDEAGGSKHLMEAI